MKEATGYNKQKTKELDFSRYNPILSIAGVLLIILSVLL